MKDPPADDPIPPSFAPKPEPFEIPEPEPEVKCGGIKMPCMDSIKDLAKKAIVHHDHHKSHEVHHHYIPNPDAG